METLEIEKAHPEFKDGDVLLVKCNDSAFMEAEVKRSIYERDCAAKSCMEKEQDLEAKYRQKLSELESEARMRISTRDMNWQRNIEI